MKTGSVCGSLAAALLSILMFFSSTGTSVWAAPVSTSQTTRTSKNRIVLPAASSSDNYVADMEYAEYWQHQRMPLKVFIHDCNAVPGFDPRYVDCFMKSCQIWTEASAGKICFEFTEKQEDADIDVTWTEDRTTWPVTLHGNELGVAKLTVRRPEGLDHASIYILTTEKKRHMGLKAMQHVSLHELGHAFGLWHSPAKTDVMYQVLNLTPEVYEGQAILNPQEGSGARVDLSLRDRTTLRIVYSAKETLDAIRQQRLDQQSACIRLINESARQINMGEYAQAVIFLNEALTIDKSCKTALENLMVTYFNCGADRYNKRQYSQALPLIEKSIELAKRFGSASESQQMAAVYRNCRQAMEREKLRGAS